MKLEDIIRRADELIQLGNEVSATKQYNKYGDDYVDGGKFAEFRSTALSFLVRVFGRDSPHYSEFDSRVTDTSDYYTDRGIGILRACRTELAGGWLFTTRGLVSAEIFSDFIEMAEHLLIRHYKDPAAVMVGSVLEEHLRQLCRKHSIPIEYTKPDGSVVPLKANSLNAELAKGSVYSKLDHKNVTAWLDLRNKAAHGEYSEYTEHQVELMVKSVSDFIARVSV